jgi:Glycogen recognition site of AMP-activated protein kinase
MMKTSRRVKHTAAKPEAVKPELVKAEAPKPQPLRTEAAKPEPVKAQTVKPQPVKAEAPKPVPATTAAVKPEPAKTEAPKPAAVTTAPAKPAQPTASHVSLELVKPDAKKVYVAGSFNEWKPERTPLAPLGNGRWGGDLAVKPGRHEYLFVVDGQWLPDPNAKETVQNPFGGKNSVLVVSE